MSRRRRCIRFFGYSGKAVVCFLPELLPYPSAPLLHTQEHGRWEDKPVEEEGEAALAGAGASSA